MKQIYKYYFRQIDYELSSKNKINDEPNKVMRALLISLSRKKLNEKLNIIYDLVESRTCGFCGAPAEKQYRVNYSFTKINGATYDINYESYLGDTLAYKLHICENKSCKESRNKLNPNSIDFVSAGYKISRTDANNYILQRNKSPFYKHNHPTLEDYKKHQGHVDFTYDQHNYEQINVTYYANKEKFINEHGIEAWNTKNLAKNSSSLNHFLVKNDLNHDLAKIEYDDKNRRCTINSKVPNANSTNEYILNWWNNRHANKNNITDKDDFRIACLKRLRNYGVIGKCIFISKIHKMIEEDVWVFVGRKSFTFFTLGCYIFNISDLFEFLDIPRDVIRIYHKYNVKMFSYVSYIDGYHFRSDIELSFYKLIKDIGSIKILGVNKKYEMYKVNKFYDFKISFNDEIYYIEICGGIDEKYIAAQLYKQKHFNSVLISKKYFKIFIEDLNKNIINKDPGAYYDH